jgi:hypothetical protein
VIRRLALLLVLSLGAVALADDWKTPDDGVIRATHVQDFLAYVKALKKVGGTWHAQTHFCLSEIEGKALNEASTDKAEIQWAKPRILLLARHLLLADVSPQGWENAEKRANEKLATALKKIEDLMKNGPKELGELDKVNVELERVERSYAEHTVATIIDTLRVKEAEVSKANAANVEALTKQRNEDEDTCIEDARKLDNLTRQKADLVDALAKAGATDGMKQLAVAQDARRDQEEVAQAKKDSAAGDKLASVLQPSLAAVKDKLADLEKALAELGSPVFAAASK